jgi:hypothetical protein
MASVMSEYAWKTGENSEVLGDKILSHCHFVHHKSHMDWPGIERGHLGGRPATKGLSLSLVARPCSVKLKFDERVFIQKSELFQTQCNAELPVVCKAV